MTAKRLTDNKKKRKKDRKCSKSSTDVTHKLVKDFSVIYLLIFLFSLQIGNLSSLSLLLRLCAGLFVDAIFLSTWTAIDPLTRQLKTINDGVNVHGNILYFVFDIGFLEVSLPCYCCNINTKIKNKYINK